MAEWPENKMNESDCHSGGGARESTLPTFGTEQPREEGPSGRGVGVGEAGARQVNRSPSSGRSEESPAGGQMVGMRGGWPMAEEAAFTAFW